MNEQELCRKRLIDLSRQANRRGVVLFSDFLGLNELNIYHQTSHLFETRTESFGGAAHAERQIVAFLPDALYYEWEYPIAALHILPAHPKFAESFGHRDVLGAVMNLGIDRGKVGDILIGDGEAYILCHESVAGYFAEHLDRIRNTAVKLLPCPLEELTVHREFEEHEGIISSNRLDALIACVYRLSRSQSLVLFRQEKVFVDGKLMTDPAHSCSAGNVVSVRGFGRFVYQSDYGETGKGRLKIRYQIYKN